tara:strand:- start:379 stop:654 length:276 start_codon:yes stop_codon:yes gene_type:complete
MLLVELFNTLTEKQIWGRKGKTLVRKYRCVGGKRHGRIVANPQQCFAPPNIKARMKMRITRKKLARRMAMRSKRTKRTNPASRALKFMNRR